MQTRISIAILLLVGFLTACGEQAATVTSTASLSLTPVLPAVENPIGLLPMDCPASQLNSVEVSSNFAKVAGGPGLRATLYNPVSFTASQLSQQEISQYGWATKILWVVDPAYNSYSTLTWRNKADGTLAWFKIGAANATPPFGNGFTTSPVVPPNPSSKYYEYPSNVFFPKAGCYELEAKSPGSSWKLTFAVGRSS